MPQDATEFREIRRQSLENPQSPRQTRKNRAADVSARSRGRAITRAARQLYVLAVSGSAPRFASRRKQAAKTRTAAYGFRTESRTPPSARPVCVNVMPQQMDRGSAIAVEVSSDARGRFGSRPNRLAYQYRSLTWMS